MNFVYTPKHFTKEDTDCVNDYVEKMRREHPEYSDDYVLCEMLEDEKGTYIEFRYYERDKADDGEELSYEPEDFILTLMREQKSRELSIN